MQPNPLSRAPELTAEVGELFPLAGQFFLECSTDGRVVWMSDKVRQRLGDMASLYDHVAPENLPGLRRFLSDESADGALSALYFRAAGNSVPVRFFCLARIGSRVFLSAEVRERVTDSIGPVDEELLWLNGIVLDKYFRLLRVQQSLDSRLRRHRNPGVLLIGQLERERARLGSALHSSVGQSLSAINVHVELIEREAPELPARVRTYLERIADAAREAGEQVRAISRPLYTLHWETLTLEKALRKLWEDSGIPDRFQGSLTIAPLDAEPSPAVKAFLYRTAQEAITNAIRHSQATTLSLTLALDGRRLGMQVEDNGRGFDPAALDASAGIGLRSIREQAEALEGEYHIAGGPGGTKLEVVVPLEP